MKQQDDTDFKNIAMVTSKIWIWMQWEKMTVSQQTKEKNNSQAYRLILPK